MSRWWTAPRGAMTGAVLAVLAVGIAPMPASAQDDAARLRKLEAEIRALQRAVFPNGDGRFFTPEVTTPSGTPSQPQVGTPSATALTDVLARLQAIETQLARLTARSEENANAIAQLREEFDNYKMGSSPAPASTPAPAIGVIPVPGSSSNSGSTRPSPAPTPAATPAPTPAAPTPQRIAAVQAIAKPSSGDAGDDEYTYGFRLWDAGFYPEARQQLSLFLQKYPTHPMRSYGQNLLGRAYLDDKQPREAARAFLENYEADKNGARAGDSLLYLAESMIAIGDKGRACIALAEFGDTYPALATGRLKAQYDRNRSRVTCS